MDIIYLALVAFFCYFTGFAVSQIISRKKAKPELEDCSHIWEPWKIHTKEVKVYDNYGKLPIDSYMLLQRVCTMCQLIETKRVET